VAAERRPSRPGRGESLRRLAEILRVDHAGELGAVHIYRGQRAVLSRGRTSETLARMQAQEEAHLQRFEALLAERRVRPTLLAPVWRVAGFALGAGTALISESAAHACTEAVETVIEDHYAGQITELEPRESGLAKELSAFRDDELAHREEAIAEGSRAAPAHAALTAVIRAGCRAAIRLSERI
jgi:ubiquinone biosynthesis monooxygenase Coq7